MRSVILSIATRYLLPLLLLFSLFILIRGHNEPGGGFIGGLIAAAALILYGLAYTPAHARRVLRVTPRALIGAGLTVALTSGLISLAMGQPFMTGLWLEESVPILGKLGTPFIFDVGVYLTVIGVTLLILLSLAEE